MSWVRVCVHAASAVLVSAVCACVVYVCEISARVCSVFMWEECVSLTQKRLTKLRLVLLVESDIG